MINPSKCNILPIYTLPRSGTWYHRIVFSRLSAKLNYAGLKLDRTSRLTNWAEINLEKELGTWIQICHGSCPSFKKAILSKDYSHFLEWSNLHYASDGYSVLDLNCEKYPNYYNFYTNTTFKITYIYRNPLDHCVSMFFHCRNHVDSHLRSLVEGETIQSAGIKYFLPSFLKQYLTFQTVKAFFPNRIYMNSYENILHDPLFHFRYILTFNGCELAATTDNMLKASVEESCIEAVRSMENHLEEPLGNDQILTSERHVRSGRIGQFLNHFSEPALDQIRTTFDGYGLSLDSFITEPCGGKLVRHKAQDVAVKGEKETYVNSLKAVGG
jgi:hypothetical protein